MKAEKPYTILQRKTNLPMFRYRAGNKKEGRWPCITFSRFDQIVRFKSREEALYYMDSIYEKYPEHYSGWKIGKVTQIPFGRKFNLLTGKIE